MPARGCLEELPDLLSGAQGYSLQNAVCGSHTYLQLIRNETEESHSSFIEDERCGVGCNCDAFHKPFLVYHLVS